MMILGGGGGGWGGGGGGAAPTPQNHHITLVFSQKTVKNSRFCGKGPFWTKEFPDFAI